MSLLIVSYADWCLQSDGCLIHDCRYPCFESCSVGRGGAGCDASAGCNFASCLDDAGFIRTLLASLLATHCVDTRHVHIAGFSTGGVLAYELGATVPGVASVAAVEAGQMLGFGSAYS